MATTANYESYANTVAFPFRAVVTNVAQAVKTIPGNVESFQVSNPGASAAYFNLYNQTAVTVGTTVPTIQVLVPATSTVSVPFNVNGVKFDVGIMVAATDISTPLSAVAPASSQIGNVQYV